MVAYISITVNISLVISLLHFLYTKEYCIEFGRTICCFNCSTMFSLEEYLDFISSNGVRTLLHVMKQSSDAAHEFDSGTILSIMLIQLNFWKIVKPYIQMVNCKEFYNDYSEIKIFQ